jgi:uncharacterized protein
LKENARSAIASLFPALRAAYLFGSAQHLDFNINSDIDIAVDVGRPLEAVERFDAGLALAAKLKWDVDLIDFRTANTVFRHRILTTGVRLFAIDPVAQDIYEAAVRTDYLDFVARRQPYLDDIRTRGRVYG